MIIVKIINQPVILSEVELSPSEKRGESARLLAEAGSRNNSWWLADGMLHRYKSHPNSFGDPIVALLLGFVSLFAQQNFDYAKRKRFSSLRMTC